MEDQPGADSGIRDELILNFISEMTNGSVTVFDRDLRYLFALGKGWAARGLKAENLIGKTIFEVFPAAVAEHVEPYYRQVLAGQDVEFELFLNERWSALRATPRFNERGEVEVIIVVEQDRDERQRSEVGLDLKEAQREITTIWESMSEAFLALDSQWNFTYVNAEAERILQRERADLLGQNIWREFPETVDTIVQLQYHKAIREGVAVHFEMFYPALEVWVDIHAYPSETGLSVYFQDISQRKRAEENYYQSQQFLQSLINSLAAHIAVLDERGTVLTVNRSWQRFARENGGIEQYCGVGANYLEICDRARGDWAEGAPDVARAIRAIIAGEQQEFQLEYPCHSAQEQRWFQVDITRFDGDEPVRVVVSHENITARKLAELELAEREAKFRTVFESVQDAILLADDMGTYIDANPAACRLLGLSVEQLLQRRVMDLAPAEARSAADELWKEFLREGLQSGEFEVMRPDGSRRVVDYRATANFLPGKHLSVLRDVTERKAAERTQSYFSSLVQSTDDAIIGATQNGIISSWNGGAERMLGYSAAEIVGRPFEVLVPTANREESAQLKADQLATGQNRLLEKPLLRKDGVEVEALIHSTLVRDAVGEVLGVFITARDITERKRAEEAQARLATIVETSHEAIISKTLDGIITSWNRGAEQIYGYQAAEAIGRHMSMLLPPDRPDEEDAILARLQRGEHIPPFETQCVRKNGEILNVAISSSPIFNASGEVIGASAIARDITERKRTEDALRASEEKFQSMVTNVPGMVYQFVLHPDGSVEWPYVSEGCREVFGVEPEQFQRIPHESIDLILPEDRVEFNRSVAASAATLTPWLWEGRHYMPTGEIRWMQGMSRPQRLPDGSTLWNGLVMDVSARKEAEAELAHSLALLEATLESTADGILVVNETGQILRWNQQFVTMWHMPDEIMQTGDNDRAVEFVKEQLIDPEEFEATVHALLLDAERNGFDLLHFKDGRVFDRYSKIQQLNDHVVGRVWSFRDVTERYRAVEEQAELARQIEHERLRLDNILSNVPGVVWENSIEPETSQHKALYTSKYVETMLGYSLSEWMSAPNFWERALHPDDRERAFAQSAAIIESRQPGVVRYRMIARDGRVMWTETLCAAVLNEKREPVGLRGVTMDISERVRAEAEQSRLAALLESTSDFVGWADTNGQVQYINPAGLAMLNWDMNEPVEECHITDLSPAWANELIMNVAIPTASRQGSWSGETALLNRDGLEIPISQVITAHQDAHGNDIFYSTIARDISESKRVQAILQRSNEDLEERVGERTAELKDANLSLMEGVKQRQMALGALREVVEAHQRAKEEAEKANRAKSEFLSRMSHELRTPLNAILGFGQILEMRELAPRENEGVQQILKAGRHLLELINEVLEISRIEAGHFSISLEPVEVVPLLHEVSGLMQPLAAQRNITVHEIDTTGVPPEGWFIMADRQRLQQVLLNLFSNAIKYNREGGSVTLSLQVLAGHEESGESTESEATTPNLLRIAVRDTGPGIALEDQPKVFLPFERLGAERTQIEGTGIGLALSQRLMELMHGNMGMESVLEQGSTFWVELPLTESLATHWQRSQEESAASLGSLLSVDKPLTLLYIEDNSSNLRVMENVLAEMPQVRLLTAIQGGIGLELARQHRPDLVLLDLHLPDIRGDEVLQLLKNDPTTNHIPVIMVSADATSREISRLLAAGARHYMTKPFNIKELLAVFEETLAEKE